MRERRTKIFYAWCEARPIGSGKDPGSRAEVFLRHVVEASGRAWPGTREEGDARVSNALEARIKTTRKAPATQATNAWLS